VPFDLPSTTLATYNPSGNHYTVFVGITETRGECIYINTFTTTTTTTTSTIITTTIIITRKKNINNKKERKITKI